MSSKILAPLILSDFSLKLLVMYEVRVANLSVLFWYSWTTSIKALAFFSSSSLAADRVGPLRMNLSLKLSTVASSDLRLAIVCLELWLKLDAEPAYLLF